MEDAKIGMGDVIMSDERLLVRWFEAEVTDEEYRLGRSEVLLILGVRLWHLRFGKPKITTECATGNAVAETEIFFGNECIVSFHRQLLLGG